MKVVEHFFILPFKWYKKHFRNWYVLKQRCKMCGCADGFNFNVDDNIWKVIVPVKYQNRVVCLSCFDELAKKKGIIYKDAISQIYFAGDKEVFEFKII